MKRNIKRVASAVLGLCMLLCTLGTAQAAAADAWDGSADTSWYTEGQTVFEIATAEQLAGLAVLVKDNSFEGKMIKLTADLDLSGHEWTSIGTGADGKKSFDGTFDGQGHIVSNLQSHKTTWGRHGLFGMLDNGGTVKNLGVVDADVTASDDDDSLVCGILADWVNNGSVQNCFTTGSVTNSNGDKLTGGLIGQGTGNTQIIGCYSEAAVNSLKPSPDLGCDTVGGIVGQWENSTTGALISDCWFGGSISCEYPDSGVGGILGANFDFFGEPGVTIRNSFCYTTDLESAEPGNITWVAAVTDGPVSDCYWPIDPALQEQYAAVVKLVVDWDAGTAGADPNFDQAACGSAVTDWKSNALLQELQSHASSGVRWVMGAQHPTFSWDKLGLPADYSAVDAAIAQAGALDPSRYQDFSAVTAAVAAVVRDLPLSQQDQVDAMAQAILDAIGALVEAPAQPTATPAPVTPPKTGDGAMPAAWLMLLIVSAAAACVLLRRKARA